MKTDIKILSILIMMLLCTGIIRAQENELYKIEKLTVNSKRYNEMTPVLIEGGIVFCSDRRLSGIKNNKTFQDDRVYNIYYASRKDTMEWGRARIYSKELKTLFTEGPFCFSPDGRQIYFTGDMEQGKKAFNKNFENKRGIFIADKAGDSWTDIRQFKHNDPLWNVAHPFISPDGKYLFFSSDIPGGQGGSDIFMCEWVNNEWSAPANLGPEVNSSKADMFPYFSASGELFFASDRAGGSGGLDIYNSRLSYGSWTRAVVLPEPINSKADDFGMFKENSGSNGFFTSNREKSDNIYRFSSLIVRKNNCDSLVIESFCYEFTEEKAAKFDSLPYEYEWDFNDGHKASGVTAVHCFEKAGTYVVGLNVVDMITGEIQYNEVSYILEITRIEQAFISSVDTCFTAEEISFDASHTNLPGWDIAEYYWSFDDGTIDTGEEVNKVFIDSGSYNVQLIISTNPDADGIIREVCVSKYVVVQRR